MKSQRKKYSGLTDVEVLESRRIHGANVLTPPKKEPIWKLFLAKFADPLIVILLVAGFLSIGISLYEYLGLGEDFAVFYEPLGIFIAIILATGLAFLFEYKAEKEFEILNQVHDDEPVGVIRNGVHIEVKRRDVVVGDVMVLSTGEEIAADGQLLEARTLSVDESSLTGEPVCRKTVVADEMDNEATYPSDHVMRGTKVMEGHGVARVMNVGDATENGKVMVAARIDDSVKTPLNEQLDRLSGLISKASYFIAFLVVVGRMADFLISAGGTPSMVALAAYFLQTLMIAVTLIVVAVPEGLPMAVTLSLAYSMRRMLKTNNLVRKMHACETMGAVTVICTDKTGTLTENQMRVADLYAYNDSLPLAELYSNMAVNSTAELNGDDVVGNPTEGALLLWLRAQNMDYEGLRNEADVVDETPFSTDRKYMSTIVVDDNAPEGRMEYVKGAPEVVMNMCVMDETERSAYETKLLQYQRQAMRTLAFARNGRFQGIVGISDPVRSDVPQAVGECLAAGIKVKIVTGDNAGTAMEIGRQTGVWTDGDTPDHAITGPEFERLSDDEALVRVGELKIISRARPMDKKRLVELLQKRGEVVAVTGDGTNDAPALKAAHVGLSMGDGTSVAKEASDITIIDNSFSSIGRAVMWGRSLYRNIQRFILFQMTVNVVACLIVLVGAFLDTSSPLTVTQMLWVNLIMDTFAALALASLPPSRSVMKERPRDRHTFIITPAMARLILGTGGVFTAVLLFLYFILHADGLTRYELSVFFTVFVFMQFWNLFNAKAVRSGHTALYHLSHCRGFLFVAALIMVGQVLIVEFGGEMFEVTGLRLSDWLLIIACTSVIFFLPELLRLVRQRHG